MSANVLPGLFYPIQNGYNALRADFLGKPVFALTYDQGVTVPYGTTLDNSTDYAVPDGVTTHVVTATYTSSESTLLETESDYDEYFSASVSGSMTYMSYSASASSSLAFHGSLFSSKSSYYALNFGREQVYLARRYDTSNVLPDFTAALSALPATLEEPGAENAYFTFFDTYGTHYLESGIFGGYYTMETRIDDSLVDSTSERDVTAGVQASFDDMAQSGKLEASMAYGSSSYLSEHESQTSVQIYTNGGMPNDDKNLYFESIFANPILLLSFDDNQKSVFQPLSRFIADEVRRSTFDKAIQRYIDGAAEQEGMLGSPHPRDFDEAYKASGDGFVTSTITFKSDGDRGSVLVYSDGFTNPSVVRGAASMHSYASGDCRVKQSTLTIPVRAGEYFNLHWSASHGHTVADASFVPFGFGSDIAFGAWQEAPLNEPVVAPSDGFVVAVIQCSSDGDGDRGYILGQQGRDAQSLTTVAATSAHFFKDGDDWIPCQSFVMPVAKGTTYSLPFKITSKQPMATAYFLPVEGEPLIEPMQARSNKTAYQAETDGFLLAWIDCSKTDGSRGTISVAVSGDAEDLGDAGAVRGITSAHYYQPHNRWVPHNAMMVPVQKGEFYKAVCEKTSEHPAFLLNWVPLKETSEAPPASTTSGSTKSRPLSSAGTVKTA